MSNYPIGVSSKDFDIKKSRIEVTVELQTQVDNGYGVHDCDLIVDCIVLNEQYIKIGSGTFFLIGNNAVELGEMKYEEGEHKSIDQLVYNEAIRLAQIEVDNE